MKQIVGVFKGPNIVHNYGVHFCFESQKKGLATRSNILLLEFGVITITWAGPGDFKITWAGPSDYNHFSGKAYKSSHAWVNRLKPSGHQRTPKHSFQWLPFHIHLIVQPKKLTAVQEMDVLGRSFHGESQRQVD